MKNIYLCGPTVYNTPHIGNMRPIITFDIYIRALNNLGIKTHLIHNITDIDDKIIIKAKEENVSEIDIAERYTTEYKELLTNYNISTINSMPKVTENIQLIIEFIEELISKDAAYISDGSVYFSVKNSENYGSISNKNLEHMNFEHKKHKKHPGDFALWKKTNEGVKFDSPWSKGRPGWHTECSLFINKELKGKTLDIHGGGIDLIFPHHENEAAQYESITGNQITKEWKHIGQLSLNGEKMSKSLGNTLDASRFADEVGPDVLRMLFLTTSPTRPINLKDELVKQLIEQTDKWASAFAKLQLGEYKEIEIKELSTLISEWKFAEANKNINEALKEFNKIQKNGSEIYSIMKLLGFNFSKNIISKEIKNKYNKWKLFRKTGKYSEADLLRNELSEYKLI